MNETNMRLEQNPNINEETVNSLRKKLDSFTAYKTQFLKNDIEFTREFMVQFLLFYDRLIYNAALENASSPITQNEMDNVDEDKIRSMAEVIAPYLEYCLSIHHGNMMQVGGKKTGGMGFRVIFYIFIALIVILFMNQSVSYFTRVNVLRQGFDKMVTDPINEALYQKELAQTQLSDRITTYNNQMIDTYFKPNEATVSTIKRKMTNIIYNDDIDYATLMTLYDKTLDAYDKVVTTKAEPYQITFNEKLPKKTTTDLTIPQQTELFEQIIAPVLNNEKYGALRRIMREEYFLTSGASCNNKRKKGERTPKCFSSGFPTSFKEAQEQILMIENSQIKPSLAARFISYFKSSDNSDSKTCDINYMIPSTVTLNGKKVNFVDTLLEYTEDFPVKLVGNDGIRETIQAINDDICAYKAPGIQSEHEKLLKNKIGRKYGKLKRGISAALHPDTTRNKKIQDTLTPMFQDTTNMFKSIEDSNEILNQVAGGKRRTRKRGKRHSKRAPRKTKTLRKKGRGKK